MLITWIAFCKIICIKKKDKYSSYSFILKAMKKKGRKKEREKERERERE